MNRILFSREGEIRPAAVVAVGLILSAIAFDIHTLIANGPRRPSGCRARPPSSAP